jgi:hypothetical protein
LLDFLFFLLVAHGANVLLVLAFVACVVVGMKIIVVDQQFNLVLDATLKHYIN